MTDHQNRADTRPPTLDSDDEKAVLLSFLNYLRGTIAAKAESATEPGARTAGVPSGTNLLGLIKHLTAAELNWFVRGFAGVDVAPADLGMDVAADESAADILAAYRAATARANEVIEAAPSLEARAVRGTGRTLEAHMLRWIVIHLIEETARHAGHADILREQLDGSIGR
ncbi:DinB family protein [Actinospica robiniae]|uniref:DinB family protein n=1 Tax=Actinospica robiniae TaxID=304901 RepID=UPI0003F54947|nr:DinB family protein [Actinospica robiniae]